MDNKFIIKKCEYLKIGYPLLCDLDADRDQFQCVLKIAKSRFWYPLIPFFIENLGLKKCHVFFFKTKKVN